MGLNNTRLEQVSISRRKFLLSAAAAACAAGCASSPSTETTPVVFYANRYETSERGVKLTVNEELLSSGTLAPSVVFDRDLHPTNLSAVELLQDHKVIALAQVVFDGDGARYLNLSTQKNVSVPMAVVEVMEVSQLNGVKSPKQFLVPLAAATAESIDNAQVDHWVGESAIRFTEDQIIKNFFPTAIHQLGEANLLDSFTVEIDGEIVTIGAENSARYRVDILGQIRTSSGSETLVEIIDLQANQSNQVTKPRVHAVVPSGIIPSGYRVDHFELRHGVDARVYGSESPLNQVHAILRNELGEITQIIENAVRGDISEVDTDAGVYRFEPIVVGQSTKPRVKMVRGESRTFTNTVDTVVAAVTDPSGQYLGVVGLFKSLDDQNSRTYVNGFLPMGSQAVTGVNEVDNLRFIIASVMRIIDGDGQVSFLDQRIVEEIKGVMGQEVSIAQIRAIGSKITRWFNQIPNVIPKNFVPDLKPSGIRSRFAANFSTGLTEIAPDAAQVFAKVLAIRDETACSGSDCVLNAIGQMNWEQMQLYSSTDGSAGVVDAKEFFKEGKEGKLLMVPQKITNILTEHSWNLQAASYALKGEKENGAPGRISVMAPEADIRYLETAPTPFTSGPAHREDPNAAVPIPKFHLATLPSQRDLWEMVDPVREYEIIADATINDLNLSVMVPGVVVSAQTEPNTLIETYIFHVCAPNPDNPEQIDERIYTYTFKITTV